MYVYHLSGEGEIGVRMCTTSLVGGEIGVCTCTTSLVGGEIGVCTCTTSLVRERLVYVRVPPLW